MATQRPYFASSIEDLEKLFEESRRDRKTLAKIRKELAYRKRPRARRLAAQIDAVLTESHQEQSGSEASPQTPPRETAAEASQPRPGSAINLEKMPAPQAAPQEREAACPGAQPPADARRPYGLWLALLAGAAALGFCGIWLRG